MTSVAYQPHKSSQIITLNYQLKVAKNYLYKMGRKCRAK